MSKKDVEVIDYSTMKMPESDIVKIVEVVNSEDAIIDEEVIETVNDHNDLLKEDE